jgi:hypothetical protein
LIKKKIVFVYVTVFRGAFNLILNKEKIICVILRSIFISTNGHNDSLGIYLKAYGVVFKNIYGFGVRDS